MTDETPKPPAEQPQVARLVLRSLFKRRPEQQQPEREIEDEDSGQVSEHSTRGWHRTSTW